MAAVGICDKILISHGSCNRVPLIIHVVSSQQDTPSSSGLTSVVF